MPVVTVEWLEGRSQEQKTQIADAVTRVFTEITKVSKDHVWIVFRDVKRSDWAMAGQTLDK